MHGCLQLLKCIKSPVVRDGLRHLLTYTYDPIRSRVISGAGFVYNPCISYFQIWNHSRLHIYKSNTLNTVLIKGVFMQIQIGIDIVLILAF